MYELYPYFTNDGSVGLFSPEIEDIYHSTYGALSEAYDKFIVPSELEKYFEKHKEIKILDICFGIGYNTKSFINFLFEKKILKFENKNNKAFTNSASIYTNNINTCKYNDSIDVDNVFKEETHAITKKTKIFIKALDIDKNLIYLSPFFKHGNDIDKKHNKLNFHYEKISKLLNNKFKKRYELKKEVNLLLLDKIVERMPEILENDEITNILDSKKYTPYFDQKLRAYFKLLKNDRCKYNLFKRLRLFLHNIYYRYVSASYKRARNTLKTFDFVFEPIIGDARYSLQNDKETYNYVFLDAFTPAKCPCLWSVDFFKLLFGHLEDDGIILTYSNSSAIRNAMIEAGFFVGKIFNDEIQKYTGTIAAKNKSFIKHGLSDYDLGLINSKAGIFYRDENLNTLNKEIIASREKEVLNSNKISSSRFIKEFRGKHEV